MTVQYRPEIFTLISVPFLDLSLPRLGGLLRCPSITGLSLTSGQWRLCGRSHQSTSQRYDPYRFRKARH